MKINLRYIVAKNYRILSTQQTYNMSSPPPVKKAKLEGDLFMESRIKVAENVNEFQFNKKRVKLLSGSEAFLRQECKSVAYYMHRDQRVQDNWAMLYAQKLAMEHGLPLHVISMISVNHPNDAGATLRTIQFSLNGLEEVANQLKKLNIAFHFILAQDDATPGKKIAELMTKLNLGCLVVDFSALRPHRSIVQQIIESQAIKGRPVYQVDAHNIVPVEVTSEKQEYAARTIRNKVTGKLGEFLTEFPPVIPHPYGDCTSVTRHFGHQFGNNINDDWKEMLKSINKDENVPPSKKFQPGTAEGIKALQMFVNKRIKTYDEKRNDPNNDAVSDLSPWFHFGQLSVQRAVLFVKKEASQYSKGFIEEAVVRRELSENFCYYNKNYDNVKGATDWAQ